MSDSFWFAENQQLVSLVVERHDGGAVFSDLDINAAILEPGYETHFNKNFNNSALASSYIDISTVMR